MIEVGGDGAGFGAGGEEVFVCSDFCARKKGVSILYDCREREGSGAVDGGCLV